MNIEIFYDGISYRLRSKKKVIKIVEKVIRSEHKVPGDLNFIITNDSNLLEINKEFLNHNYFTDVIAFGNNVHNIVGGEVYISLDTVRRNSANYKVSLSEELLRVIIHGTLHLCGYEDDDKRKKDIMHSLEDKWIGVYKRLKI